MLGIVRRREKLSDYIEHVMPRIRKGTASTDIDREYDLSKNTTCGILRRMGMSVASVRAGEAV